MEDNDVLLAGGRTLLISSFFVRQSIECLVSDGLSWTQEQSLPVVRDMDIGYHFMLNMMLPTMIDHRQHGTFIRGVNGLPDDNMLPTCCHRVKGPLTRSDPTTRTGLHATWVKPPLLSSLQGRQ